MNLEKWTDLRDKTAALSLRERIILTSTGIALVVFVWFQVFFIDIEKTQKQYSVEKNVLQQDALTQSQQLSEVMVALAHDPNAGLRAQQKQINSDLSELRMQIEGRLSHLIAPEKMADVMKDILSDYQGLRLVSAKNLPVEPLKLNNDEDQTEQKINNQSTPEAESQAVIFTHGFEMTLSGTYFQTLAFLERLENMNGFYWRKLAYEVERYPDAKITIQLNTLSLEEDWIGV
jgi:MSHA biogenesis protein MshJ